MQSEAMDIKYAWWKIVTYLLKYCASILTLEARQKFAGQIDEKPQKKMIKMKGTIAKKGNWRCCFIKPEMPVATSGSNNVGEFSEEITTIYCVKSVLWEALLRDNIADKMNLASSYLMKVVKIAQHAWWNGNNLKLNSGWLPR